MTYMPMWYRDWRSALVLLQSLIGLFMFSYSMKRRSGFLPRLLVSLGAGMLFMFAAVRHLYVPGSDPRAMLSHAAISGIIYVTLIGITWFCFEESVWSAMFAAASGYLAQDIGGSVKTIFRRFGFVNRLASSDIGILFVDLICYGLVYFLIYLLIRPFAKRREGNFDNKIKAVFSVAVLMLCIGMARLTQDNPDRNNMAVFAEAVLQIIIDVLAIALQFGVMEQARLAGHVETMRELVHQQRVQYEASKESARIIAEKYHDLKHLLKTFRGTVPQEQLDRLKQSIAAYERPANSGNEVLDVLLAEKIGICQQRGIVLTCSLGQTDFSFVEELDLYSLFQNALTNAIDAVSALPEKAERFIVLSASRDGNMLTIHMENPCAQDIVFVDELPQTQGDPNWHGFGMKSMVRIAEKYNGTLSARQQGRLFLLDILLLAPESR